MWTHRIEITPNAVEFKVMVLGSFPSGNKGIPRMHWKSGRWVSFERLYWPLFRVAVRLKPTCSIPPRAFTVLYNTSSQDWDRALLLKIFTKMMLIHRLRKGFLANPFLFPKGSFNQLLKVPRNPNITPPKYASANCIEKDSDRSELEVRTSLVKYQGSICRR